MHEILSSNIHAYPHVCLLNSLYNTFKIDMPHCGFARYRNGFLYGKPILSAELISAPYPLFMTEHTNGTIFPGLEA